MTERAIERIIREAIERGEFDNLPGAGKPLDLSDADDPDWWVKRLIRRERLDTSGGLPGVFGLRRERESFPESLLALSTEAAVREVLEDYNRRVKLDRLTNLPPRGVRAPVIAGLVDVEEMAGRWARRRAELAAQTETAAAAAAAAVVAAAVATQATAETGTRTAQEQRRPADQPAPGGRFPVSRPGRLLRRWRS